MPAIKYKVNLSDAEKQIFQTAAQKGKSVARISIKASVAALLPLSNLMPDCR